MKTSVDFQNDWFEDTNRDLGEMRVRDTIEEDIKLIEQKHQQLEGKISKLEDRSYGLVSLLRRLKVLKRGKKVRI